jgi:hypothetical protein
VSDTGWTRKLSAWVRNGGGDIEIIINALIVEVTCDTEEILDSQKLQGSGSAPNSGKASKGKGTILVKVARNTTGVREHCGYVPFWVI